jgi:ElaB/YqjD/DUF883 family membrane-anchored ribosome-binding protein
MANTTKDKLENAAGQATQKAKDLASNVADKAKDLAATAADKADSALSSVGSGMATAADKLRDTGPREGYLGSATRTVADKLANAGGYLQEHGVSDIADDMTTLVKRYPIQSLLVGFGVGLLFGMAVSRR